MIQITNIENVNHVVVYMTGEVPFPDGYAGAVYFNYQLNGEAKWIYLGKLCNEKPSSIFKITNLKNEITNSMAQAIGGFSSAAAALSNIYVANIGISVEPIAQIDALTPAADTSSANLNEFAQFTEKMLQNFYNYASSFSKDAPDGSYVPLSTLTNWFETFKRRLSNNPNFWKQ